ncbi:orotidine-5'-phosphate decarboxylase, partial [bacterium]|nr:orotidine-5'-phosphate decarboxylase [bacterium]
MLNPVLSQLKSNIQSRRTYLCVGLDPDPAKLPSGFSQTIEGVEVYLKEIIRLSSERCIAYKPNISFFEGLGIDGLAMLQRLRNYVPAGTPWIIDGKRGDIGNTSAMQARFLFDHLGADASTLHPYMGNDSLAPFFEYRDKLHFVLALTSNPGSATF